MFLKNKRNTAKRIALLAAALLLVIAACAVYLCDFYPADMEAVEAFAASGTAVMRVAENGNILWEPEHASAGFIFYPGGKVEHTAYIPLMSALAAEDILCVLVEMPFHLAVFDVDAADGIQEEYPQIENWHIGGHSLGGSMAASYLSECADSFDGLVLLGSYSTADLSETELHVLSVYGSEDMVMNREKYQQNKQNLPADFQELMIDGGCHAYFGMYGAQKGDGTPEITNEAQIILTAQAVADAINRLS